MPLPDVAIAVAAAAVFHVDFVGVRPGRVVTGLTVGGVEVESVERCTRGSRHGAWRKLGPAADWNQRREGKEESVGAEDEVGGWLGRSVGKS